MLNYIQQRSYSFLLLKMHLVNELIFPLFVNYPKFPFKVLFIKNFRTFIFFSWLWVFFKHSFLILHINSSFHSLSSSHVHHLLPTQAPIHSSEGKVSHGESKVYHIPLMQDQGSIPCT